MESQPRSDSSVGISSRPMEILIRAALVLGLAWFCYQVFSPFLTVAVWSVILAVTLYPAHRAIARKVGGRQWLASVLIVIIGLFLIVTPTALLMSSFADSLRDFITSAQNNTLNIPSPPESVQSWPLVGKKVYEGWSRASSDLPGVIASNQPKIGEIARSALAMVASVGTTLLLFFASFIIASIIMAYGESGSKTVYAFFNRVAGPKGNALADLSNATVKTVALGVLGIAAIQAILVGGVLLIAGVPGAGVLAIIALVLGIAQIPAIVVIIPALIYIWGSGNYETTSAAIYTVILLLAGLADNVLKPIFLGRGVDVPMPVILFGALGGMAGGGILGMFVGATALALGYEIFMAWVKSDDAGLAVSSNGDAAPVTSVGQAATADS